MMKEEALSASEFWEGWEKLYKDDRFVFVTEPADFERVWKEMTSSLPKGQCAETDAYFAALAQSGGRTLVTFDRGFRRFPELRSEVLL
jgi:predicted nucleic acid-binding protein